MINNTIEPSISSLLLEAKTRSRDEAVVSQDQYSELVEDIINEKLEWGELNTSEDIEGIKEELLQRWPEVEAHIREKETTRP